MTPTEGTPDGRSVIVFDRYITRWEDPNEKPGSLLRSTWPRRIDRGCHAGLLPFRVGGGDDLSASLECVRRAAELAHAHGQLQQLESFCAHADHARQCCQSQAQVHD